MQFIPIPQSRGPRYARCWRSGVEERERNPYDLPCSSAPLSFVFSGSSMLKFLFLRLLCLTLYFPLFPPFLCVEGLAFGTKNLQSVTACSIRLAGGRADFLLLCDSLLSPLESARPQQQNKLKLGFNFGNFGIYGNFGNPHRVTDYSIRCKPVAGRLLSSPDSSVL